jgi:hypothetical protein
MMDVYNFPHTKHVNFEPSLIMVLLGRNKDFHVVRAVHTYEHIRFLRFRLMWLKFVHLRYRSAEVSQGIEQKYIFSIMSLTSYDESNKNCVYVCSNNLVGRGRAI